MNNELIEKCFAAIWTEFFGEEYVRDLLDNSNFPEGDIAPEEFDTGIVLNDFERIFYKFTTPSLTLVKQGRCPAQFLNRKGEFASLAQGLKDAFWSYLRFCHPTLPGSIGIRGGWKLVKMPGPEIQIQPMTAMPPGLKEALTKALVGDKCDDPECKVCHPDGDKEKGGRLN